MDDCIFCKITRKEAPAEIVKETDNIVVFKELHPKAPIHFLIVPKKHLLDITQCDDSLWSEIKKVALGLSSQVSPKAFRLVVNAGDATMVKHMHVHFLGDVGVEREV